jgi:uncharacterized membrane protein
VGVAVVRPAASHWRRSQPLLDVRVVCVALQRLQTTRLLQHRLRGAALLGWSTSYPLGLGWVAFGMNTNRQPIAVVVESQVTRLRTHLRTRGGVVPHTRRVF